MNWYLWGAIAQARKVALEIVQLEPRLPFVPPVENKTKWQAVHNYFTQKRGIPEKFVQTFYELGLIYADKEQNAVFGMRDLDKDTIGAFLRITRGENNTF
jgi:hypothetical protein